MKLMKEVCFLFFFVCSLKNGNAQILQESFDNTTFPPTGWYKAKISPTDFPTFGQWERVTDGTAPVVTPHSGAAMARFNSPNAGYGTISELGTPALNLSGGAMHRIRFWLYRMDASNTNDLLDVYASSQPNIVWGTKIGSVLIARSKTPSENANGWYEYTFDIPALYNISASYIIFRATGNSGNTIYIDDVVVETIICHKPISTTVTGIATTTATLNWAAPATGSPSGYEWEVRTTGSAGTGAAGLTASGSASSSTFTETVSALTAGTAYKFYVRSSCGTDKSTWSDAVSFTTQCNAYTIPYTENFDANFFSIPACTAIENVNGGYGWATTYSMGAGVAKSAPNALYCQFGGTGNLPQNDWFFTAPLALEAGKCYEMSFDYRTLYVNYAAAFEIKFGTAATASAMTSAAVFSNLSFIDVNYKTGIASIKVNQTGTYFIGFHHIGSEGGSLILDDINVKESVGVPQNISISNNTATSATINWTAPACGTATDYDWEIRTSGNAGSGATGLIASGNTTSLFAAATGLSEGLPYTIYVRSKNGSLISSWSNGFAFNAACTVKTLPYFENFDGVTAPALPVCYYTEDANGGQVWRNVANSYPRSAPNALRYEYTSGGGAANDWFFTPPFALQSGKSYRVSFYYRAYVYDEPEKLELKFGQGATSAAMTSAAIFSNTNILNTAYVQGVADFTATANGNFNIGFHCFSDQLSYYLRIDDILVTETPACDTVRKVAASNITTTTAKLSWQLPLYNVSDGFEWELRTSGAAGSGPTGLINSGSLATASVNLDVAALTANTSYTFYIRNKSALLRSEWTAYNFKTACVAVAVPYAENFDAVTVPQMPGCFAEEDKPDDIKWVTVADGNAVSAPAFIYHHYNIFAPVDDWFFTAPVQLYANTTYKLSFYVKSANATYSEALEVKMGNYAQSSAMNATPLFTNSNIRNTTYQKQEVTFTATATGGFYFGFHSFSFANQAGIFIDDISVVENIPTPVRDIVQTVNELLQNIYPNPVDASFMLKVNRKYDAGKMIVRIRDMQGRLVQSAEINLGGSENYRIETEGLTSGMYLIETIHLRSGKKQTVSMRKK